MKAFQELFTGYNLETLILYGVAIVAMLRGAPSSLINVLDTLRQRKEQAPKALVGNGKRR